ncbi:MAG: RNA polymerase sigma factor [Bacillota bacterium]|jgi:RNA polymerase sigma-70 factor (ECF subfamily)
MKRLDDKALVSLCIGGQKQAFNILVIRYEKQIFALAYRLCRNYDEARDLAQEAFLHIYRHLSYFDSTRPFFPWMYKVARNICLNKLNKDAGLNTSFDDLTDFVPVEDKSDYIPELALDKKEISNQIYQAIENLPQQYKEAIILKYIQGYSYKEISQCLDLPESTIETRLYRGRQALQKTLAHLIHKK